VEAHPFLKVFTPPVTDTVAALLPFSLCAVFLKHHCLLPHHDITENPSCASSSSHRPKFLFHPFEEGVTTTFATNFRTQWSTGLLRVLLIESLPVPTRREESRYKLTGPGGPEGGPRSDYVAHVFVLLGSIIICRLYKLTLSDQAQVPLQLRVSISDLE
jgi:hypothetical protein